MGTPRFRQLATVLFDGRVLISAGATDTYNLDSCEIYDPNTGTWTPTGLMNESRSSHTATLMFDGKVVVTGGQGGPRTSAESYDPLTDTWTLIGNLAIGRSAHRANLLLDGTLLISGGYGEDTDEQSPLPNFVDHRSVATTELGSYSSE